METTERINPVPGLSKRLNTILGYLEKEDVLCDIGADHGQLVLAFASQVKHDSYATEIANGPFDRLEENVEASPYGSRVKTYQADGLSDLPPEVNALAICGMGGETIAHILSRGARWLQGVRKMIIEPQGHAFEARLALTKTPFVITDETYVLEKGRAYPVIYCARGVEATPYEGWELEFGRIPVQKGDPILREYLKRTVTTLLPLEKSGKIAPKSKGTLDDAQSALKKYR